MSFISDVLDFERFNLKEIGRKLKADPERLLLGNFGIGPESALLGYDQPVLNMLGGPPPQTYLNAQESGINTGPGQTMHDIATAIASMYAGQGLGGLIPGGGQGMGGNPLASLLRQKQVQPKLPQLPVSLLSRDNDVTKMGRLNLQPQQRSMLARLLLET